MASNIEIIRDTGKRTKNRNIVVLAKCHCGKEFETDASSLRRGRVKSCGCSRIKNYAGFRKGRLLVLTKTDKRDVYNNSVVWNCICDCGKELELSVNQFTNPKRLSCGCDKSGVIRAMKAKSGKNHHWYNHNLSDSDRTRQQNYEFTKSVLSRDDFTCRKCCKRGGDLNAHHMDSYHWCIDGRNNPNNGITLCKLCHDKFHFIYGNKWNTQCQTLQYLGILYV